MLTVLETCPDFQTVGDDKGGRSHRDCL